MSKKYITCRLDTKYITYLNETHYNIFFFLSLQSIWNSILSGLLDVSCVNSQNWNVIVIKWYEVILIKKADDAVLNVKDIIISFQKVSIKMIPLHFIAILFDETFKTSSFGYLRCFGCGRSIKTMILTMGSQDKSWLYSYFVEQSVTFLYNGEMKFYTRKIPKTIRVILCYSLFLSVAGALENARFEYTWGKKPRQNLQNPGVFFPKRRYLGTKNKNRNYSCKYFDDFDS